MSETAALVPPMTPVAALRIHASDNVATCLADAAAGDEVVIEGETIELLDAVGRGHKFALAPIARGERVVKYGFEIGRAIADIAVGAHVHSHNLATALSGEGAYRYTEHDAADAAPAPTPRSFAGYRRADGRVGTRNEIWILPTVGCVGNLAARVARIAGERHAGRIADLARHQAHRVLVQRLEAGRRLGHDLGDGA